jgi:excisionase family DNA binding protein
MAQLLDGKEAAKRLNITEDQLAVLVQDGEITYINVGRGKKRPRRRYASAVLKNFVRRPEKTFSTVSAFFRHTAMSDPSP